LGWIVYFTCKYVRQGTEALGLSFYAMRRLVAHPGVGLETAFWETTPDKSRSRQADKEHEVRLWNVQAAAAREFLKIHQPAFSAYAPTCHSALGAEPSRGIGATVSLQKTSS
jgi:hypothetical protein